MKVKLHTMRDKTVTGDQQGWRHLYRQLLLTSLFLSSFLFSQQTWSLEQDESGDLDPSEQNIEADGFEAKAAELDQLRSRIQQMRKLLDTRRDKKDKVRSELRTFERKIGKLSRALRKLKKSIKAQSIKLARLKKDRKQQKSKLNKQRDMLAGQIRASFAMGRQEQIKILLNQGDPSTVQRALVYYDYLNRSRTERISSVLEQLERLVMIESKITKESARLKSLQAKREQEHDHLKKNRKQRARVLVLLKKEISNKDRKLKRMLNDEKDLQTILDNLDVALADLKPENSNNVAFAKRKGNLPWPAAGKLAARFGKQRSSIGSLRWNGILISAPMGNEVHAVSHGRIAFADWLRGYGMLMIIDHGDGFMSLYGHNQSLYKEVGEWVNEGDVLATIGDSGGQSRSGLYFELRRDGKPVNPVSWCRGTRHGKISLSH